MNIFICPKCGANLIDVGITEITTGGTTETFITFEDKCAKYDTSKIRDIDEQWILCGKCGE